MSVGEFVGILGFSGSDYATIDLACVRMGAVCVPLQASASAGNLTAIIEETGARVLASSVEFLETALECALRARSLPAAPTMSPERPSSAGG